jgi:hypothetical protein
VNVEHVLLELQKIGKPKLGIYGSDNKWHANIELPAPAGCQAKVSSDFTHDSPSQAMQQLLDRMNELRQSQGGGPLEIAG